MESDFREAYNTSALGQQNLSAVGEEGENNGVAQASDSMSATKQSPTDTTPDENKYMSNMSELNSGPIFNKIVHSNSGLNDASEDKDKVMSTNKNKNMKEHSVVDEEDKKSDIKPNLENDFDPGRVKTEIGSSDDDGSYDFSKELGVVKSEMFDDTDDDSGNVPEASDGLENLFAMRDITCEDCNKPIHSLIEYNEHLLLHADDSKDKTSKDADGSRFTCLPCNKVFDSKKKLSEHNRHAHSDVQHSCDVCGKTFTRKDSYENHLRIHNNLKEFKCDLCDKRFNVKKQMRRHRQSHFKEKSDETTGEKKEKLFSCPGCDAVFSDGKKLADHKRTEHPDLKGQHKCTICNKTFFQRKNLRYHMKIHGDDKEYKCDFCDEMFRTKQERREHKANHKDPVCKKCDNKQFNSMKQLMDHIYKVHAEAKYTCQFCGKSFNTKQKLNRHSVVHSDYRPFGCVVCNQKFKLRKTLSRHMMTHSGDKNYTCDECGQSYKQSTSLNIHKRIRHPAIKGMLNIGRFSPPQNK